MNDEQLLRYSRQLMLPEIDITGQQQLAATRVAVIGIGGLGSAATLYLAAAGLGTLELVDPDEVDLSNLQRQILYRDDDRTRAKVAAAQDRLAARNPECQVHTHAEALTDDGLVELCERVDLVLDGTDHFTSRESINRACLKTGTPLVWGAAIRWEGQVTVFDSRREDSPCYRCLQPAVGDTVDRCAESGVVGPVVGTIGCLMATEAIKLVVAPERAAVGRLTHYDAWGSGFSQFQLPRLASCPACGAPAA